MSNVELLPLPEWCLDNDWARYVLEGMTGTEFRNKMQDYARANVAHATAAKDAEIEALRAELREMRRAMVGEFKRAERLAEALGEAADALQVAGLPGNAKRFRSLLRDHEEGKRWTRLKG